MVLSISINLILEGSAGTFNADRARAKQAHPASKL